MDARRLILRHSEVLVAGSKRQVRFIWVEKERGGEESWRGINWSLGLGEIPGLPS